MDPNAVLFAIEAGVRLGRRLNDALISDTAERSLLLPVGELFGEVTEIDAIDFFDAAENQDLVRAGGPYANYNRKQLVTAYRTLQRLDAAMAGGGRMGDARQTILGLHALEQLKKGYGPRPAYQQIIGEVVNIGIDYFVANPHTLGRASPARRIVQGLLLHLDDTDFSTTAPVNLVGDVLLAAFTTLQTQPTLLDDSERLHALLGGVTTAVIEELQAGSSPGDKTRRRDLLGRIVSAVLQGGAQALTDHIDGFLPPGAAAKPLVKSALNQVLAGIRDHHELFSNEWIEQLFRSTLVAVGEDPSLYADAAAVERLIASTIQALTKGAGKQVFHPSTAGAVVNAALQTLTQYTETLARDEGPLGPLLARTVSAVASGLSNQLAGTEAPRALLSKLQLIDLTRFAFQEVARQPLQLLGSSDDPRKTALAQVLGSVTRALGDDPTRIVNGDGLRELIEIALRTGLQNADKLLDFQTNSPRSNALFDVIRQISDAAGSAPDGLAFAGQDLFLDIARRLLPLASANIVALAGHDDLLKKAILRTFALATGALDGRVNAANLPILLEGIVRQVLWQELDLDEEAALVRAATTILRAA